MQILIVDDNPRKRKQIADSIFDAVGPHACVEQAATAVEAKDKLEIGQFDLMVLDLLLPTRQGEDPKQDGGVTFLKQILKGGPRFKRPIHILGLTAHEELATTARADFSSEGWQLIQYDESSYTWSEALQNKVRHIAESIRTATLRYCYDLAIITALKPIELEAVLNLPGDWREQTFPGDATCYHVGTFTKGTVKTNVIAAAASEMGMPAAASLATKLIIQHRPRYLAMSGIAAGVGLQFGDIIVADQSWDYGSGKIRTGSSRQSAFAPAPSYIPLDSAIKEKAELFATRRRNITSAIQQRWPGNPVESVLKVCVGPVASGAAVVEDEKTVEAIKSHNRKLVGIEMEIYGVYHAARTAPEPRPLVFAAKSVCDFGVPPKTDEYQRYAAFTSANFIHDFYFDQLVEQISRGEQ